MTILDEAANRPDELALDDGERARSWAELVDRATRAGRLLRDELGLQPGDHVAMLMGNRVEFPELALGALLAGLWMTPINWHLKAEEARYILGDAGARMLFADPDYQATARAATEHPVLVAGDELDRALAGASDEPFPLDGPPGGSMLYTSGTTGRPKGVKRPLRGTLEQALQLAGATAPAIGLDDHEPHLITGPLYHAGPLGFGTVAIHSGSPWIIMPRWDPAAMLQIMMGRGVSTTHMVPIMFVRSLRLPDEVRAAFDPSSLRTVLHGAAPVSPPVKAAMIEWWGEVLLEYWGSTEGGVFTLVDSHDWLTKPGTVGKAIALYEVFAVDESAQPLPAGKVGTLYTRNLMTTEVFEYHEAPEKTAGAFLGPGTFTMGDVGWVDEDGYVFLCDRAADMVISGGVNIYPAEIEQCLMQHPAVRDVAVFGIPDEEWGESVKAAVELLPGYQPGPELEADLLAFARQHLANYKVPRSVDFEPELPRQPTGKLYKRLLRDRYWQREGKFI